MKRLPALLAATVCSLSLTGNAAYEWKLVTDVSVLTNNSTVIIAALSYNFALSTTQNTNNRGQATITKYSNNTCTFGNDVQQLTLGVNSSEYTFYTGAGYLYAAGGSGKNNYLKTEDTLNIGKWTVLIDSSGSATIKATNNTIQRNWMRYNSSNNPPIFSCYASGQNDICLYMKTEVITQNDPPSWTFPVTPTLSPASPVENEAFTMDFSGCVTDSDGNVDSIDCTVNSTTYTTGNGVISIPANTLSAGTYSCALVATDDDGDTANATYSLTIAAAPAGNVLPEFGSNDITAAPGVTNVVASWTAITGADTYRAQLYSTNDVVFTFDSLSPISSYDIRSGTSDEFGSLSEAVPWTCDAAAVRSDVTNSTPALTIGAATASFGPFPYGVGGVQFAYTQSNNGGVTFSVYLRDEEGPPTLLGSRTTGGTAGDKGVVYTFVNASESITGPCYVDITCSARALSIDNVHITALAPLGNEVTGIEASPYSFGGLTPATPYAVGVIAVDSGTGATNARAFSDIVTTRSNAAPTISTSPSGTASALTGHELRVELTANDTDTGDTVTLSVSPDNLGTLSGSTFTWTPAANASGTQNFTFTATDPYGAFATAPLAVTVRANSAPVLSSNHANNTIEILENQTASATISASDSNGDTVTLAMDSATIPASAFTPSTGVFSWTTNSVGTYTATFTADDHCGGIGTLVLTIEVSSADVNLAPEITVSPTSVTVNVRDSVEAEITADDPNGDNVILTMTSEDIPPSAFDEDDGYGVLIWTAPTAAGTYTASFTATDDADDPLTSEAVTFTVVVTNAAPEIILSDNTLSCNAGEEISTTVMGSDLFAAPKLSVSGGGTLGTSSVSSNGNDRTAEADWTWTPTTPGTHTITFTAADADDENLKVTTTLTVTVGLAAPMNLAAPNIASTSATLSWNVVTGATSYCVSATYVDGITTNAVFTETFNQNTSSGGHSEENPTGWAGNGNPSAALKTDVSGWSCTKQNGAYQCAKFGTSSVKGEATTPPIGANGGTAHLLFRAAPWQGDSNKDLVLTVVGDGSLDQTEFTLVSEEWKDFKTTLTGATSSTKITFAAKTSDHNRFFLDEVSVVYFEPNVRTIPEVSVSGTSYTATGLSPETTYTYSVKATYGTVESSPATVVFTTTPPPPPTALLLF